MSVISKWGNSLAVRIPKSIIAQLKLEALHHCGMICNFLIG
ncbi:MAG: AbrB/MazE/SpoVT family DNA-binding domain-containing protein [Cyanobacterium sp. T60_A2020_053]|nr:AbrB/MazE/SpoVT family DNA-binding domain-containing protein [Cyanobacterium sp. T60_A2020_053]